MNYSNLIVSMALARRTKEVAMVVRAFKTCLFALVFLAVVCSLSSSVYASSREMTDLNLDLQQYLEAARLHSEPNDRIFISEMAVQNIRKQWVLWSSTPLRDENWNSLMGSSYTRFILLQYHLDNPSWVEWGLTELETLLPSYKAYIDSSTTLSYGEQLAFIEEEWMGKFAECNAFNELVPLKKLTDNPIDLIVRKGCYSDEDKYVLRTAELFLNRQLLENRQYFYFYVPIGEYQISDRKANLFPKEFSATGDSAQFVYLTPNYSFNFVPVVQVFSEDGVYFDTLSPSEFELVRLDEGRAFEFENLEFGRYQFRVKPPYKLVDGYPNKLIIPKEEFGSNYLDRHSELFDKDKYDKVIISNGESLVYTKVEMVLPTSTSTGDSDKKKDKGW